MQHTYLFSLGHQPHISVAEIRTVLSCDGISFIAEQETKDYLEITTDTALDVSNLIQKLGGTVSIAKYLIDVKNNPESLAAYLIKVVSDGKITFSIEGNKRANVAVKRILRQAGRPARFVQIKNTASIIHNDLVATATHLIIWQNRVFYMAGVQPIEEFSTRDYDRPGVDAKSGMLPPKLARIMINLTGIPLENKTLLDPFCGSGTVLMEAALLGAPTIIGTDISEKAILDAQKNINWLEKEYDVHPAASLFEADARDIQNKIARDNVDLIVTEPYLGKPLHGTESKKQLLRQASELQKLYENAFLAFKEILKSGATIVIVIPQFRYEEEWIVPDCINKIIKQGFCLDPLSSSDESLLYWRPGQHVGRMIWRLRFKKH